MNHVSRTWFGVMFTCLRRRLWCNWFLIGTLVGRYNWMCLFIFRGSSMTIDDGGGGALPPLWLVCFCSNLILESQDRYLREASRNGRLLCDQFQVRGDNAETLNRSLNWGGYHFWEPQLTWLWNGRFSLNLFVFDICLWYRNHLRIGCSR